MKAKSAWDFFEFYANKNMSSPVILIGSNPDALSIQKAMTYTCVKNYIQKPLNNAMAKRINSKDAFIWNNQ
jgi:response regulator of citrate/malate metabolism